MAAGTVQTILYCASAPGTLAASGCPQDTVVSSMSAYVIDPASAGYIDGISQPFDIDTAGAFWGASFLFLVGLYIGCAIYGRICDFVKKNL